MSGGKGELMDSGRIKAMTDTFYAFAMTLLVAGFNVPKFAGFVSERAFNEALAAQRPMIFVYVLSFFLLAKFWMANHREFSYIDKIDHPFLWLNFCNLLLVVFIPYSTDLIGEYVQMQMANIVFAANLGLIGLLHYAMWIYVAKHNLYSIPRKNEELRHLAWDSLRIPILSVIAIILSFYYPSYSSVVYVASPFIQYALRKKLR